MNDSEIIVIDNIIDLDYQEQIKSILLGEINYKDYEFPWYYTKDVTKSDCQDLLIVRKDLHLLTDMLSYQA